MLTQNERPFRITTTLGPDVLLLENFEGYEAVSQPYEFRVEMIAEYTTQVQFDSLLRKGIALSIELPDGTDRTVHGIVNRFALVEAFEDGRVKYEAHFVPSIWFLSRFSGCRIFQNKTIPDIIEQVFADRGITNYKLSLQGTYKTREYVVQYRETDLNFISRWMEFEGIYYYFEHSEDKHTVVLGDSATGFPACPSQETFRYATPSGPTRDEDLVHSLRFEQRVYTGQASLQDYDFTKPKTNLRVTQPGAVAVGEDYDYPGRYDNTGDGEAYATKRIEAREAEEKEIFGRGNCRGFEVGHTFTLQDHFRTEANIGWAILSLRHFGRNTPYRSGGGAPAEYHNTFTAIPKATTFRPMLRTPRPTIKSAQTAVVVGPSGEEIYTDQYGRVKVQFFWDREGQRDENSSCWMRVSHAWAGKGWGSIYIPRINQEVIVSFLEGDPDQPIISGRVYNADQVVPYALPDMMTKSTLKSMSTKGGGGFNEFRFEDLKGSEQIFMHGEKDLDIRIKNDRKEWIGHDRHLVVVNDKKELIKNNDHIHIKADQMQKIDGNRNFTLVGNDMIKVSGTFNNKVEGDVKEKFGGAHHHVVSTDYILNADTVTLKATTKILFMVGGNWIMIDSSGIQIKGTMVKINCIGMAMASPPGDPAAPLAPDDALDADNATPGQTSAKVTDPKKTPDTVSLTDVTPPARQKTSASSDAPAYDSSAPANQDKKSIIKGQLVDESGTPIANEPYRLSHSDGTVTEGTTDSDGRFQVDNVEPGSGTVTFPNMDHGSWEQSQ